MTIEELSKMFPGKILPLAYPKPFPAGNFEPEKIKAIVLGCDPSNFSKKNGTTNELETVFGLEGKGKDNRYFRGILKNIELLGLTLQDIYVQNLCRNYFTQETSKNSIWQQAARVWAESLKRELHDLEIPAPVPVLLTSQYLYHALIKDTAQKHTPKDLYSSVNLVPIKETDNILGRKLIPLYRGGGKYYLLSEWPVYKRRIADGFVNGFNWDTTNE